MKSVNDKPVIEKINALPDHAFGRLQPQMQEELDALLASHKGMMISVLRPAGGVFK